MTSTAMPTNADLRDFLMLPYSELEELNLRAKQQRQERVPLHALQEQRLKYLADEPRIKALTVLFSDLEGRLHMLDYDKKFLLRSHDNLTFDGSSIRGFTPQRESDLRRLRETSAARSRNSQTTAMRRKATRSTPPTRSKVSYFRASMPNGATTRPA